MNEWILPQGEAAALMPGASYSLPGLFLYSKLIYQCLDQVQDKFGYAIPVRYLYGSPKVLWNCGRLIITDNHYTREEIGWRQSAGDHPSVDLFCAGALPGGPRRPCRKHDPVHGG